MASGQAWLNSTGKTILNSAGKLVLCADCPCGAGVPWIELCETGAVVASFTASLGLTDNGVYLWYGIVCVIYHERGGNAAETIIGDAADFTSQSDCATCWDDLGVTPPDGGNCDDHGCIGCGSTVYVEWDLDVSGASPDYLCQCEGGATGYALYVYDCALNVFTLADLSPTSVVCSGTTYTVHADMGYTPANFEVYLTSTNAPITITELIGRDLCGSLEYPGFNDCAVASASSTVTLRQRYMCCGTGTIPFVVCYYGAYDCTTGECTGI